MSEAMSSVEIEDVLSSIRRLVSEDLRPASRQAAVPKPDEKLMLTSALRVVVEKVAPVAEPVATPRPSPLPRLHLGTVPATDELVATLERAVEAQDIEWESEVGDPAPLVARMEWTEDGWAAIEEVAAPEDRLPEATAFAPEPEPEATYAPEPEATLEPEAEAALDPEPAAVLAGATDTTEASDATTAEPEISSWAQTEPDQDIDHIDADSFEFGRVDPIAVPDDHWADRAEAEAVAALRATDPGEADAAPADEMTYDEQILRDLVRDLIREELQGALGERITRNVRKLVRAEIARAIASQELE
jgi:hypothetical protein